MGIISYFYYLDKFGKFINKGTNEIPRWQLIYSFSSAILNFCAVLLGGMLKMVFKKVLTVPIDQLLLWLMNVDRPSTAQKQQQQKF